MDEKKNMILTFAVIFALITLGFACVLIKIGIIQFKEHDKWMEVAAYQEKSIESVPPMRGNILDAEGRMLAGSMPRYRIFMDMRTQALHLGGDTLFYNNLDSISIGLARIFQDKSAGEYRAILVSAFRQRAHACKLQRRPVTYVQMKEVKALPLFRRGIMKSGLHCEEAHQRVKPFGSLASRSLGNVNSDTDNGRTGLESSFNQYLTGKPGLSQKQRVQGRWQNVVIEPAVNGMDVVTTLDANLQDLTESLLRQRLEMLEGEWGCCILMETQTGEIKAITNLDRMSDGTYSEQQQHALQRVEPGSTFKTIALMAALEAGVVNYKKDSFRVSSSGWSYRGLVNTDAHALDTTLSVCDAMAISSNIALAKMITQGFRDSAVNFVKELQHLGIGDSVPSDISGAQNPVIRVPNDGATLARMAYGYSVELSPLNIITIYNAIANDGKMMAPMLVKEVRSNGEVEKEFEPRVLKQHICSATTLRELRECLHAVVWKDRFGTAAINKWNQTKAQSKIVPIAGKTGTAQIWEKGIGYSGHHHRITFVGYFPEDNPQYTCLCMIHYPHTSVYDAGNDCGATVKYIAERTMAYNGTMKGKVSKLPYDSIRKPSVKAGRQALAYHAARDMGLKMQETDCEWTRVDSALQVSEISISTRLVPNTLGMGARDAVFAIEQTGMKAQIHGRGRVCQQSVSPGTSPVRGSTVYLELR